VSVSIWDDPDFRAMANGHEDARQLFLYLLTCKHLNLPGLFVIPKAYAMHDLNWTMRRTEAALSDPALAKMIQRDPETDVVLILNRFKHNPLDTENKLKGAVIALNEVPITHLDGKLIEIIEKFSKSTEWGLLVHALRMRCASNTLSDTDTDTDTDTEADTDTDADATPAGMKTPARACSEHLLARIRERDERAKDPNWKKWDGDMDKIMRLDKRTEAEVHFVIDEAHDSDFWRKNILSPDKLRKQFSRLWIEFMSPKAKRTTKHDENMDALRRAMQQARGGEGHGDQGGDHQGADEARGGAAGQEAGGPHPRSLPEGPAALPGGGSRQGGR